MVLQCVDHTPIGSVVGLMTTFSKRTYATHTHTHFLRAKIIHISVPTGLDPMAE